MSKYEYMQQSGETTTKVVETRHTSHSGVTRVVQVRYHYNPGMPLQRSVRRYNLFPATPK